MTASSRVFKPFCLPLKVNTLHFPAASSTGTAHGNQPPCRLLPWQMRQPFVWWRTSSKKRKLFWQLGETQLESVTGFSLSNPARDLLVAHAAGRASALDVIGLIQHLPESLFFLFCWYSRHQLSFYQDNKALKINYTRQSSSSFDWFSFPLNRMVVIRKYHCFFEL